MKFHIRSLERIGRPETSLTATGKKPWKSSGKTGDCRHILTSDLHPGFSKRIAKLGVSDRDQRIRSLLFASLGEFSSPKFRHHDIDLMPRRRKTCTGLQ